MIIETKFDLNDFVYYIKKGGIEKKVSCEPCASGKKNISLCDSIFPCSRCYGNKYFYEMVDIKWRTHYKFKIRFIGWVIDNMIDINIGIKEISYGGDESHPELISEECIFKTEEEAHIECIKRNGEKN